MSVPKRGLGDATIAHLVENARHARVPLLTIAQRPDVTTALRPAARTALDAFVALVQRLRLLAVDAAVDEVLRTLVEEVQYAEHLRAEGPEGAEIGRAHV